MHRKALQPTCMLCTPTAEACLPVQRPGQKLQALCRALRNRQNTFNMTQAVQITDMQPRQQACDRHPPYAVRASAKAAALTLVTAAIAKLLTNVCV